jgi:4-hydroxythreonine-4-phosphate dehydrogenase
MNNTPRLAITLGDVAGIGPEIVVKAWGKLCTIGWPVVYGDVWSLEQTIKKLKAPCHVHTADARPAEGVIPCLQATSQNLKATIPGKVTAEAGQAAFDFLTRAITAAQNHTVDAIVTAPLHKEGLRAAGLDYPGHTEILAEKTSTPKYAMVLFGDGLAVAHVTLHCALKDVFAKLTPERILDKIQLLQDLLPRLGKPNPRIAVAALNPHASDGGLFGDEEQNIIWPAIQKAQSLGINASGPYPCDTLFVEAHKGTFDGVVVMYHDQGHIAMKFRSGGRCVNITSGLPIIRTSVAHGTAYNIAGQGIADENSLIAAAKVAAKLAKNPAPAIR